MMLATPDRHAFRVARTGYELDTDPARLDLDAIHGFLKEQSYWARGLSREVMVRAIAGSLPVGIYANDGTLAAFGRVVTDYAVFAYLRDVFTFPSHRGRGLASWLAQEIRHHPELGSINTWMLATRDAHAVYEKAGYRPAPHPENYMIVPKREDPS